MPSDGAPPFPFRKTEDDLPRSRRGGDGADEAPHGVEASAAHRRPRAARRTAAPASPPRRTEPVLSDADREALELLARVEQRVEVAKSFFRLTAGLLTQHAARASSVARVVAASAMSQGEAQVAARLGGLQKIARAATAAAIDVTSARTAAGGADDDGEPEEPTAARRIPVRKARRAR